MKRGLSELIVVVIVLLGTAVANAECTRTITFDEYSAGNIDGLYDDLGVGFAPPAGAPGHDAEIVPEGTWGITGNMGPQFLGCNGIVGEYGKSSGFVF